jgi:hypothetical protein
MHRAPQSAAVEPRGQSIVLRFPPGGTNVCGFNVRRVLDKLAGSVATLKAYPEPRGIWDRLAQSRVDPVSRLMQYGVSALRGGAQLEDVLAPWHEGEAQLRALAAALGHRPKVSLKERLLRMTRVDSQGDVARSEALANLDCRVTRMRHVEWAEHEARELLAYASDERRALGLGARALT